MIRPVGRYPRTGRAKGCGILIRGLASLLTLSHISLCWAAAATQPASGSSSFPWRISDNGMARSPDLASPLPARPPVLIVSPIHSSEPASNLEDMLACVFRHPPTVGPELRFDVLITMSSGMQANGRGPELTRIVQAATRHVLPAPPSVFVDAVYLEHDAYDRDNKLGRHSSYAGPNTAFYDIMSDDGCTFRRHTSRYAYIQIMETDCCALRGGWLDELMAPMRTMPHILVSGSRVQATCYSSSELGRCRSFEKIPP